MTQNWQPFFQWCEATWLGTTVRESLWMFPLIECVHLLALALLGGALLALDLRLLGFGLRSQTTASVARQMQPWLTGALVAIIATGIPMFLSEAIKCYFSPPFFYKMSLLLLATIFTYTVRRRVAAAEPGRVAYGMAGLTALASQALWLGVGFSGRWIAFY